MRPSMNHYLNEIKNLVSCPGKIYNQLYLYTINQFLAICNDVKRLKLTIVVLKLRQGILLPKSAGAEMIAAEEAQWTYALFSASLLKGLSQDVIDQVIPTIAKIWLKENYFLYSQWQAVLSGTENEKNDLAPIIQRAAEKLQLHFNDGDNDEYRKK